MKRILSILVVIALGVLLLAGNASALGIDISATVNPNWNDSWNDVTLTGTALYSLYVDSTSAYGANVFTVTFENDIFASLTNGDLISPGGWTLYYYPAPNMYSEHMLEVAYGGSDVLEPGETPPVSFSVDYTLFSADQFSQASGSGWAWNEGGRWQQSVSATNNNVSLGPFGNPSGGTSTAMTPEPASMLLLGTGLVVAGLVGYRRRSKS